MIPDPLNKTNASGFEALKNRAPDHLHGPDSSDNSFFPKSKASK
jgi:hypothetical protein